MTEMRTIMLSLLTLLGLAAPILSGASPNREVRIGVIAGVSGDYAPVFQNFVDGITLAYEEHRAQGAKPAVRLFVEDDEFRAAKGLSAYQKLVGSDKIDALINGSSMTIGAIYPLVSKTTLPVIQLGEETEAPRDDNVIQILPGNIELERGLGAHLAQHCPKGSPLFYSIHPTMERFVNSFKEGFGGPLSIFELDPGSADVKSVVARALGAAPRCAILLTFPAQGAQLVKEIRNTSGATLQLAFDANLQAGINEYRTILGDLSPIHDAVVAVIPSRTSTQFQKAFEKRFGRAPGVTSDMGYDAFRTLVSHYRESGTEWVKNIATSRFDGASGSIEFDAQGVRRPVYEITTVGAFFAPQ